MRVHDYLHNDSGHIQANSATLYMVLVFIAFNDSNYFKKLDKVFQSCALNLKK